MPAICKVLRDVGYARIVTIGSLDTDADVTNILTTSGLLVAEVNASSVSDIYGMAHSMFVPTIRFTSDKVASNALPRLLLGHPGGYQRDLLEAHEAEEWLEEIRKRASAMRDRRKPISDPIDAFAYLNSKRFRDHCVFISHNLQPRDADLIEGIFSDFRAKGISAWEYRHNNRAGAVWRDSLDLALRAATDVVFIMDNEFERSPICQQELEFFLQRKNTLRTITPFFWGGRSEANKDMCQIHHKALPNDFGRAAACIVEAVEGALFLPLRDRRAAEPSA